MNTDACSVDDMNIHHITECSSLSSVASIEVFFVFFVPDHSPCARMIWIPTTNLILLRRLQLRNVEALLVEGEQQVSPFYHPSIHQISTLEKTKFH